MKYRFKTLGVLCIDRCPVKDENIGSINCQNCEFCTDFSGFDNTIECKHLKHRVMAQNLGEIQSIAYMLTLMGFDCSAEFAPYVNLFSINLYNGKWKDNNQKVRCSFYTNRENSIETAQKAIDYLTEIIDSKVFIDKIKEIGDAIPF